MSDFVAMVLTLGGTLIVAMGLLYLSLLTGHPPSGASKRGVAEKVTAVMAATNDQEPDRRGD